MAQTSKRARTARHAPLIRFLAVGKDGILVGDLDHNCNRNVAPADSAVSTVCGSGILHTPSMQPGTTSGQADSHYSRVSASGGGAAARAPSPGEDQNRRSSRSVSGSGGSDSGGNGSHGSGGGSRKSGSTSDCHMTSTGSTHSQHSSTDGRAYSRNQTSARTVKGRGSKGRRSKSLSTETSAARSCQRLPQHLVVKEVPQVAITLQADLGKLLEEAITLQADIEDLIDLNADVGTLLKDMIQREKRKEKKTPNADSAASVPNCVMPETAVWSGTECSKIGCGGTAPSVPPSAPSCIAVPNVGPAGPLVRCFLTPPPLLT